MWKSRWSCLQSVCVFVICTWVNLSAKRSWAEMVTSSPWQYRQSVWLRWSFLGLSLSDGLHPDHEINLTLNNFIISNVTISLNNDVAAWMYFHFWTSHWDRSVWGTPYRTRLISILKQIMKKQIILLLSLWVKVVGSQHCRFVGFTLICDLTVNKRHSVSLVCVYVCVRNSCKTHRSKLILCAVIPLPVNSSVVW